MIQYSCMLDRKKYAKDYRLKNREKINAYNRAYLADPEHKRKHQECCKRYKQTPEAREKNRIYQREYYRRKKAEKDKDVIKVK